MNGLPKSLGGWLTWYTIAKRKNAMEHYSETDPNYDLAVLFNELYNLRPWVDLDKTGPVEIHGVISAWMSTNI